MRPLRITAAGAGGLLLLALLAAWQVPRFLDWDRYRSTVERVASAGLGYPVRIAGPIRLSLLPQATLHAEDVTVAGLGQNGGAVVDELRLRVGLGALVFGRVEPQDLLLHGARIQLPWPLAGVSPPATAPAAGLHARLEDATLTVGGLAVTAISGTLTVSPVDGTLSAAGLATAMGRPWRMTGRLGQAGADGSATIALSLDGQGAAVGTGGALAGQVARDGSVSGHVTGRGPDLSLLLPAPSMPWRAEGRLSAGSGLVVADELELAIGDAPSRGAVALRLLPQLRLDAALATNRLQLDAWLPPLLRGGAVALPTGIDLSAEAATLSGGTIRRLRAGFDLAGSTVTVREADAVLPGEAALHLAGTLAAGKFRGDMRLAAPSARQTLGWLQPRAPAIVDALPPGEPHTASLTATVQADADTVSLAGMQGELDGVPVAGDLAVHGGARPAVAAKLRVTGPVVDGWVPALPGDPAGLPGWVAALPRRFAGFDADLVLAADRAVWNGTVLDQMLLDAGCRGGVLDVRRMAVSGPGLTVAASGAVDGAARVSDGLLSFQVADAARLAGALPVAWRPAGLLLNSPASLSATVSGPANNWNTTARAELADLRAQANGRWDPAAGRWNGSVSLQHPGTPRLLTALGLAGLAGWLGDGSLSLQAGLDWRPGGFGLSGMELSAGALRAAGDLMLARAAGGPPLLTGAVSMDTLPLPVPDPHATGPLPLAALAAGNAQVTVHAAHVLWGGAPDGEPASALLTLADRVLRISDVSARLGNGLLTGQVVVDSTGVPKVTAEGGISGFVLDKQNGSAGPLAPRREGVDLLAGRAELSATLAASGYSPAALLASLQGPVRLAVENGIVGGFDAAAVLERLKEAGPETAALQAGLLSALSGGTTPFGHLDATGTVQSGVLYLAGATIAAPAATIQVSGSLDLPGDALDLAFTLRPALDGAPTLGLRLIGPADRPARTPGFADLTRWLSTH